VSTRTAGVSVVNLQLLHAPLLVSYLVMMYISVYPVAISVRRTNVYEEQSLGIFAAEDEEDASFLGRQQRYIKANDSNTHSSPTWI
jgi:Trk-type K+ transport system membrane component